MPLQFFGALVSRFGPDFRHILLSPLALALCPCFSAVSLPLPRTVVLAVDASSGLLQYIDSFLPIYFLCSSLSFPLRLGSVKSYDLSLAYGERDVIHRGDVIVNGDDKETLASLLWKALREVLCSDHRRFFVFLVYIPSPGSPLANHFQNSAIPSGASCPSDPHI